MEFDEPKGIYLQLRDLAYELILTGKWAPQERIPSVREMGVMVQVNPNTVLRTYELLQRKGLIFNKRGIGYFIAEDAVEKVVEDKKEEFFKNILPKLFRMMKLLKLTPETI
ncbi:MAG: GntR family transcriptional regulator, partial [Bacteroidota bacterium]|nr:GntR family transcriptional regulator [Bacteroidota bacterium]